MYDIETDTFGSVWPLISFVFLRDAEIMQQKQKKANDPKPADEKAK